jgi:hypothetical protein
MPHSKAASSVESIHGEASLDYPVYSPFLALWSTMGVTPGLLMGLSDSFNWSTAFLTGTQVALTGTHQYIVSYRD